MINDVLSIEEVWLKAQMANIKYIKLNENLRLDTLQRTGDMCPEVWQKLLIKLHPTKDYFERYTHNVYALDSDLVESFQPLKLKDFSKPLSWYYIGIKDTASNTKEINLSIGSSIHKRYIMEFRYKDKCLMYNDFDEIRELSADSLVTFR